MGFNRAGVRYRDGEFELRCEGCSTAGDMRFWPLTLEFWDPSYGMTRCRACWLHRRARTLWGRRNKKAAA